MAFPVKRFLHVLGSKGHLFHLSDPHGDDGDKTNKQLSLGDVMLVVKFMVGIRMRVVVLCWCKYTWLKIILLELAVVLMMMRMT